MPESNDSKHCGLMAVLLRLHGVCRKLHAKSSFAEGRVSSCKKGYNAGRYH